MQNPTVSDALKWIKTSQHPLARFIFNSIKSALHVDIPVPKFFLSILYNIYKVAQSVVSTALRIILWTPLFKGRLNSVGKSLYLYGGIPFISGPLALHLGNNCRVSALTTMSARSISQPSPVLMVGDNVDIGWMTTIAVGSRVEIGNNVRIAGRAFLAGYPGHPLDPVDRAKGLPDKENQIGDIILEDDVWLATGVTVLAGVHIGHGTIVAAGSVVTHDLPSMVVAAGCPAKVIRSIAPKSNPYGDAL